MSVSMIAWLLKEGPFESAVGKYLLETPTIPQPFYPPDQLEEHEFCIPDVDSEQSDEQEYFFCSPRVHFEFCTVVDSLVHQAFSTRKLKSRSDNFQLFRSFISPFLICAPYRPWNEYGGNIGTAISPRALRGVLRYRTLCDFDSLQVDFDSLGGKDPWRGRDFNHFLRYEDFRSYIDRFSALVSEATEKNLVLLIGVY
jgi:hypothetical protein